MPFVLRRMGSAWLLPVSLLVAVTAATAVTTALAGFGAAALPAAVHQRLARAGGTAIQISGQFGAGILSADTPVIHASLRSALGNVPFTLLTGHWSDKLGLPQTHGTRTISQLQAADLPGFTAHAVLVSGRWPSQPRPGQPIGMALPATAAGVLHLPAGTVLALRDSVTGAPARLRVTGLYRPRDPAAAYWRLSLLGSSGRVVAGSFITYGPALVSPRALARGHLTTGDGSWLATVDTARIPPAAAAPLAHRVSAATASLRSRQALGGLQVTTGLPAALSALASGMVAARSLLAVGSLELILLVVATASLAGRLLAGQREEETALLGARGAAAGQLAFASLAEAVLLAVTGGVAGALLGGYLVQVLMTVAGLPAGGVAGAVWHSAGRAWWFAACIVALVIAIIIWPVFRPATPLGARLRRGRQAALAGAAQAGLDVALIGLGVAALWELRRYSAVPRLSGGGLGVDPVLTVAPALAIAGIALLPLRALPATARLLDRLSTRSRRLAGPLASWQISRRPLRQGGPLLLVVLAVATGTLAIAQHQSWRQSQLDRAAFAAGADVRVTLARPLPLSRAGEIARPPGVLSAMPVSTFDSGFPVFAIDARAAPHTVLLRPDLSPLPAAAVWQKITPHCCGFGLVLPGTPARLQVTARLSPPRGSRLGLFSASLSVQDGWGAVYPVPAGHLPADGRYHELTAGLSATAQARYPLRVLALTLGYRLPGFPAPPYRSQAAQSAALRALRREAAQRVTLAIGSLAVSSHPAGPFAGPG